MRFLFLISVVFLTLAALATAAKKESSVSSAESNLRPLNAPFNRFQIRAAFAKRQNKILAAVAKAKKEKEKAKKEKAKAKAATKEAKKATKEANKATKEAKKATKKAAKKKC